VVRKIKKYNLYIAITALILAFTACQNRQTPSLKKQLKNLDYEFSRGTIGYFQKKGNATAHIDSLHGLYTEAYNFYVSLFGQSTNLKIAYLHKNDYNKLVLENHPYYGIPFMEENTLIIPAESKGMVFKYMHSQLKKSDSTYINEFGHTHLFNEKGIMHVMQVTAIHEIIRHFQQQVNMPQKPHWQHDYISSYLLIHFLNQAHPNYNTFITSFCQMVIHGITPNYRGLQEFEKKYHSDEHSYSYYQSAIHLTAHRDYQKHGKALISKYLQPYFNGETPQHSFFDTLQLQFNH